VESMVPPDAFTLFAGSFAVDSVVFSVPEPGQTLLNGVVLLIVAAAARRRRRLAGVAR